MERPWLPIECDVEKAESLARELGVPVVIGKLLVNRGITSAAAANAFFNPSISHLHDPYDLRDVEPAVERLAGAVESGEKIRVQGDYDVDGVTSTALLVRTLRALKANVDYRIPHRRKDGYGFKVGMVDEAAADGVKLIVTCDCGITSIEAVQRANELGIDVIVSDHHEPGPELPSALAVINPKRSDCAYPFCELAGVGVAFKLAHGLVRKLGHSEESFLGKFTDLAALGTVADVVPLLGENRTIVSHGLLALPQSKKVGIQSILRATNLHSKPLTAYYLAYVLGPRINAVGRMDDASTALQLLLTADRGEADDLVREMERFNSERKEEQERVVAQAMEQVATKDLSSTRVLVLSGEEWNQGVVGIAAGKICETFGRPAILISRDEESGIGHGSARSIQQFNVLEGLYHCRELLAGFGGHALAAGLSIAHENIEQFERELNKFALDIVPEEALIPRVEVEAELSGDEMTRELVDYIERMEPFGTGNPEPLFMSRGLAVVEKRRVGGDGSHLRLQVQVGQRAPITCIAFGFGDLDDALQLGENVDLCYSIRLNRFNGTESIQLVVKDIHW